MKTRSGYVSNSSSSSFIVYGRELDYYDALSEMENEGSDIICILDHAGISGDCEDFVFGMTRHRLEVLERNGIDISGGRFILATRKWFNDGGVIDIREPLTGGRIYVVVQDDSSPASDSDRDRNFSKWVKIKAGQEK